MMHSLKNGLLTLRQRLQKYKRWTAERSVESAIASREEDGQLLTVDGLIIPKDSSFGLLVGLYKVYLMATTITAVLMVFVFGLGSVMMVLDDREELQEVSSFAIQLMSLTVLVVWAHVVFAWIGILRLKTAFLWIDLWFHCLLLTTTITCSIISFNFVTGSVIVIQVGLVALVFHVIHELYPKPPPTPVPNERNA